MARKSREWHVCDRCGVEMDKPFHGGESGTFRATFTEDYAVAGGVINWNELCSACNDHVEKLIRTEKSAAREARASVLAKA